MKSFFSLDTGDDNKVSKEEFCSESAKASVAKWVKEVPEDWEAEFDKIDTNKGGQILFKEFVEWAVAKNLDLEDDIDEAPVEPAPAEAAAPEAAAPEAEAPAAAAEEEEKKE